MTTIIERSAAPARGATPTDRVLTASLIVAPAVYLAADTMYAFNGWSDATAAILHVLGAIAYGLVVLRIATWLPGDSALAAWLFATAVAGSVGNAAYGFDAIHQSLGDIPLVDQQGAANLIKPLGLIFPISLGLVAWGLQRLEHRREAALVLVAAMLWPVAHIANISPVAIITNVILATAFGLVTWRRPARAA